MPTSSKPGTLVPLLAGSALTALAGRCFTSGTLSPSAAGARHPAQAVSLQSELRPSAWGSVTAVGAAGVLAVAASWSGRRHAVTVRAAESEKETEAEEPKAEETAKPKAPPAPPKAPAVFNPIKQVGVTEPLGFWDPVGICPKDETVFNEYRAAELKHGRVAMMAALGAVTQHFIRLPGFTLTNFGKPLPAGLGAVTETPGTFGFTVLFALAGVLELSLWKDGVDVTKGTWTKEPGNFGDPLGLGQYTEDMRNRELNNGRFAMFAAFGIIVAELVSGKDAVEQLGL